MLVKIISNCVVSFEVRTTISCNSRLVSVNFSFAITDHFINSFGINRQTRPGLKVGICGEHGDEPSSVEFCHQIGLDYVSCSPYRVPIARLAAAYAALNNE